MDNNQKKDHSDQGLYFFHQGTNYRAYELLGAHYNENQTVFRTFAPNAKRVSVVGDFNNWDPLKNIMNKITDNGVFEVIINGVKEYDCYQYAILTIDDKLLYKSDPYAFHSELRPKKASKIYNLDGYNFHDNEWLNNRKNLQQYDQPLNIYEVHLGSWRRYPDQNFFNYHDIAIDLVNYVKMMGYTHIEVMPISEYPYDPSWGYQVTGYYAITSRYGTPKDFMAFVDIMHQNNIGVIIDWVPGHFTKDSHGLIEFDGSCVYEPTDLSLQEHKSWGTRCFDYGKNEVQSFLVSNALFLLDKFHLDGIRVDAVASMLYLDYDKKDGEWHLNEIGTNINLKAKSFLQKTNAIIHKYYPGVIVIAEESTSFPQITYPTTDGGLGFDYKWNMGWMNDTLSYMKTDPIFRHFDHHKLTFQLTYIFSEHFILALSHDEVVHLKASMINKMPGSYEVKFAALKTYYTYMMTHPGKKLLFMGGEIGQFREWSENRELDWSVLNYPLHQGLQSYVRDLNHLYKKEASLYQNDVNWDGFKWLVVDDQNHNLLCYERLSFDHHILVVILNFADCKWQNYQISLENGEYSIILSSCEKEYGGYENLKNERFFVQNNLLNIDIPSTCGIILRKEK